MLNFWETEADEYDKPERIVKINGEKYVENYSILYEDMENRGNYYYKKEDEAGNIQMILYDKKLEEVDYDKIGYWGGEKYKYLEYYDQKLYYELVISGELEEYLIDFDNGINEMVKSEMKSFKEANKDAPDYERLLRNKYIEINGMIMRVYIPS